MCVSLNLFKYLFLCTDIFYAAYVSVILSDWQLVFYLFVSMYVRLFVYLFIVCYLSFSLSVYLFVLLLFVYLFVRLSVCLSFCLRATIFCLQKTYGTLDGVLTGKMLINLKKKIITKKKKNLKNHLYRSTGFHSILFKFYLFVIIWIF
jgi:hypothetical protein